MMSTKRFRPIPNYRRFRTEVWPLVPTNRPPRISNEQEMVRLAAIAAFLDMRFARFTWQFRAGAKP
jgi:hypothetical protein